MGEERLVAAMGTDGVSMMGEWDEESGGVVAVGEFLFCAKKAIWWYLAGRGPSRLGR